MAREAVGAAERVRDAMRPGHVPMAEGPHQLLAEAALYPWYEITFYPVADALTSGCADDRRMSVSRRHGGGRDG